MGITSSLFEGVLLVDAFGVIVFAKNAQAHTHLNGQFSERLVENLAGSGRPLYALSNMPAEVWPEVREAFPVLSRFRHVVVSGEIKLIKPDPKIFHYTLARMGGPVQWVSPSG